MIVDILTLFPGMFDGPFDSSIIKRARDRGLLDIDITDIRLFSGNKHNTVDDTPYGGGAGMVMQAPPILRALEHVRGRRGAAAPRVVLMCPTGLTFNQVWARDLAQEEHLVIICGHYEGVDERVRELAVTDELSIGDYVLTGGELPAMVVVDAVARMIPGVLGESASAEDDSFYTGLLEYPQYTRPGDYNGLTVPDILLSGHHENIRRWRRRQSLLKTLERRSDLLRPETLADEDKQILRQLLDAIRDIVK
ncbi:tRNA (guanine37-N1)-methyltransferase [Desulfotomaculum arcticum]|uniref:tRNA (guanine-N(1)-)-methyltransferase n=1 Tax=Desulfotruncus arcticus DSM 17038 TaxID=1121424 RepID=A0A1I2RKX3_9FIRM|nr:tRNA (guanosine(37)-N1)-methyltransferase TrmD [Desulfotruncus arcticus]SFG40129.1 tRNA (guanine37-N1)-methyltransferase [Desulfotomaculum arcticum] [Desulfotruncus arcticus DSM 17038]